MVLAERSSRLVSFRHTLNLLKKFPSVIPAAMHLNFLTLRLYKFMLFPEKQVTLFSPQHDLQLTSMWLGMPHSLDLLPGDILRRIMLTSAVYDIQPFPQLQFARSEQCVSTTYLRRHLEKHREGVPKGG